MTPESEDFWPTIPEISLIRAPRAVLIEQAALLGQKTRNMVTASVNQLKSPSLDFVSFGFDLLVPALGRYRVRLFKVSHEIRKLYPLNFEGFDDGIMVDDVAEDEKEFLETLKKLLQHQSTVTTIQSLLAQCDGLDERAEGDIPF